MIVNNFISSLLPAQGLYNDYRRQEPILIENPAAQQSQLSPTFQPFSNFYDNIFLRTFGTGPHAVDS